MDKQVRPDKMPALNLPSRVRRGPIRWVWYALSLACVLYTISHLADALYYWSGTPLSAQATQATSSLQEILDLPPNRLELAAVISDILREDGIVEAELWAMAIARHIPTDDPGYVALVMAQIRRESRFNAPELEWLYDNVVPDLLHQARVIGNPINTVGPMQINRHQLLRLMRANGEKVDFAGGPEFSQLVSGIDSGVRYAVLYLDEIFCEYVPTRRLYGWPDYVGHLGIHLYNEVNQPVLKAREVFRLRETVAAYQKMLSDLLGEPLVLDGVFGPHTVRATRLLTIRQPIDEHRQVHEALDLCPRIDDAEQMLTNEAFRFVCERWQQVYGSIPTLAIYPRISHDPRLVYILADFNAGKGSCRVAAMQQMLNILYDTELLIDGDYGPNTLAAIRKYILQSSMTEDRRSEFLALIDQQKKLIWVRSQVSAMLRSEWQKKLEWKAPEALCPEIWMQHLNQQQRKIQRMSTWDYVSVSVRFFEDYYVRLQRKLALRDRWSTEDILWPIGTGTPLTRSPPLITEYKDHNSRS